MRAKKKHNGLRDGPTREKKNTNFGPILYINVYISETKVADIMTQRSGHIMYGGRVLNTSLPHV